LVPIRAPKFRGLELFGPKNNLGPVMAKKRQKDKDNYSSMLQPQKFCFNSSRKKEEARRIAKLDS
jgi:hypothetical protein